MYFSCNKSNNNKIFEMKSENIYIYTYQYNECVLIQLSIWIFYIASVYMAYGSNEIVSVWSGRAEHTSGRGEKIMIVALDIYTRTLALTKKKIIW